MLHWILEVYCSFSCDVMVLVRGMKTVTFTQFLNGLFTLTPSLFLSFTTNKAQNLLNPPFNSLLYTSHGYLCNQLSWNDCLHLFEKIIGWFVSNASGASHLSTPGRSYKHTDQWLVAWYCKSALSTSVHKTPALSTSMHTRSAFSTSVSVYTRSDFFFKGFFSIGFVLGRGSLA